MKSTTDAGLGHLGIRFRTPSEKFIHFASKMHPELVCQNHHLDGHNRAVLGVRRRFLWVKPQLWLLESVKQWLLETQTKKRLSGLNNARCPSKFHHALTKSQHSHTVKKQAFVFFSSLLFSLECHRRRCRRLRRRQSHSSLPLDTPSPHGLKVIIFLVLLVCIVLVRRRQPLVFSFSLAHLGIARRALGHVRFPCRLPHYAAVFVLDGTLATVEVVLKKQSLMRQRRRKPEEVWKIDGRAERLGDF